MLNLNHIEIKILEVFSLEEVALAFERMMCGKVHSSRVPFDRERLVTKPDLRQILEAGRWTLTTHNMQNLDSHHRRQEAFAEHGKHQVPDLGRVHSGELSAALVLGK